MKQQRLNAYLRLIQGLLSCPHGEEWTLLQHNEQLVNPELAEVMEQVAQQLSQEGKSEAAKFLHHWAGQLNHIFEQAVHVHSKDEKSQAYLQLIQALLDCPGGSESEILAANQDLIDPRLVRMMKQVATQMAARGDRETALFLSNLAAEISRNLVPVNTFKANLHKDAKAAKLDKEQPPPQPESVHQPEPPPKNHTADLTPIFPSQPAAANTHNLEQQLTAIADSLTRLEQMLASRLPPTDPLWYMNVLENAHKSNWILSTEEVEKLIGVKPRCDAGQDSFQRGCWVFMKIGKMGSQTAWRVIKEDVN
ncbi:MAG: hypothetical protein QNJ63_17050 [Calothrix sp. MO_192.B10]|nr:hypothetical protein [Calothrix sp. MO_192.B10]